MGNRAVLTFGQEPESPCIYLHWSGGRASVEAFLDCARQLGLRIVPPGQEASALDSLAEMIARHFFGCDVGHTVYRHLYAQADADNGDNGIYLLNRVLSIGGRSFAPEREEVNPAKTVAIVEKILARAPVFNGGAA